jgi:hypothetical protein
VPTFERLRREVGGLDAVNIDVRGWLEEAGLPCAADLLAAMRLFTEHRFHGSRSDLLRALALYLWGGIYLDTDTLTLRDMTPARALGAFVAQERILVDSKTFKANSRWRYLRTAPLTLARDVCSRFAWGVRCFQWMEPRFVQALHHAVMGFPAGHRLPRDFLVRFAETYQQRLHRYGFGPDTVQDLVAEHAYEGLAVLPPRHFSPFGPTMTYQYFRTYGAATIDALTTRLVRPDTSALHWSNNGTIAKAIPQADTDVGRLARGQIFSRLAAGVLAGAPPDADARPRAGRHSEPNGRMAA